MIKVHLMEARTKLSRKRPREGSSASAPVRLAAAHALAAPVRLAAAHALAAPSVCELHGAEAQFFCRTCSVGSLCALKCIPLHRGHDWDTARQGDFDEALLKTVQSFWPPEMASRPSGFPTTTSAAQQLLREHTEPPLVTLVRNAGLRCVAEGDDLPVEAEAASDVIRRAFGSIIAAAELRRDELLARVAEIEATKQRVISQQLVACEKKLSVAQGLTEAWVTLGAIPQMDLVARADSLKAVADARFAETTPLTAYRVDATIHAVVDTPGLLAMLSGCGTVAETATARLATQLLASLPVPDSLLSLLRELRERAVSARTLGDPLPHGGCLSVVGRVLALYGSSHAAVSAAALEAGALLLMCDDAPRSVWQKPYDPDLHEFVGGTLFALRSFPMDLATRDAALSVLALVCDKAPGFLDSSTEVHLALASALSANAAVPATESLLLDFASRVFTTNAGLFKLGDHSKLIEAATLGFLGSSGYPAPVTARAADFLRNLCSNSVRLSTPLRGAATAALVSEAVRVQGREFPTANIIAALASFSNGAAAITDADCARLLLCVNASNSSVSVSKAFIGWVKRHTVNMRAESWTPDLVDSLGAVIKRHVNDAGVVSAGLDVLCGSSRCLVASAAGRSSIPAMVAVLRRHGLDEAIVDHALTVIDAATRPAISDAYGAPPLPAVRVQQEQNVAFARECGVTSGVLTALTRWAKTCPLALRGFTIVARMITDHDSVSAAIDAGLVDTALTAIEQFDATVEPWVTPPNSYEAAEQGMLALSRIANWDRSLAFRAFYHCSSRAAAAVIPALTLNHPGRAAYSIHALRVAELLSRGHTILGGEFLSAVKACIRKGLELINSATVNGIAVPYCCWVIFSLASRRLISAAEHVEALVAVLQTLNRGHITKPTLLRWATLALAECRLPPPSAPAAGQEDAITELTRLVPSAVRAVIRVTLRYTPPETALAGLRALVALVAVDPRRAVRAAVADDVWPTLASVLKLGPQVDVGSHGATVVAVCLAAAALLRAPPLPHAILVESARAASSAGLPALLDGVLPVLEAQRRGLVGADLAVVATFRSLFAAAQLVVSQGDAGALATQ